MKQTVELLIEGYDENLYNEDLLRETINETGQFITVSQEYPLQIIVSVEEEDLEQMAVAITDTLGECSVHGKTVIIN
jgi:hypothetical protein